METFPLSGFLQEKAQLKTHRGEKHFHTHTELGANKRRGKLSVARHYGVLR